MARVHGDRRARRPANVCRSDRLAVVTVQIAVCARWLGLFWPEHEIVELEGVWRYGEVVMVVPGTVYVFNVEEARPPGTRGAAVVRRPFPRVETVR